MYESVFSALNERGVRYLIAGGVAVILHGYVRATLDLDVIVDLDSEQARGAIEALSELGLVPRVPVDPLQFADPAARSSWIRDRGMQVFTMLDPEIRRWSWTCSSTRRGSSRSCGPARTTSIWRSLP